MDDDRAYREFSMKIIEAILQVGNPGKRRINIGRDYDKSKYVNSEACKSCGGKCCQKCGCHFAPEDFRDLSFDGLRKEIEKGYISIDLVDGEMFYQRGFFYMLRARNEGAPIVDFGYKRSKCCLLTENGCKLQFEERPAGGRMLIPGYTKIDNLNGFLMCTQTYEVEDCCLDWRPYSDIVSKLVEHFKDKDFPCTK